MTTASAGQSTGYPISLLAGGSGQCMAARCPSFRNTSGRTLRRAPEGRSSRGRMRNTPSMAPIARINDGMITLRPPQQGDAHVLIAGRDQVFHRWLGPGSDDPQPTACIEVAGEVVGWVDYDSEREWLQPGEVNVGYNVFGHYRGKGYATRAVQLLIHHLAVRADTRIATLVIDAENHRSVALARRLQFELTRTDEGQHHFARPVPPLTYSDGVVVIRSPRLDDLDADLDAKDDRQIDWMWLPGERETWAAMSPRQQRDHARAGLERRRDDFGTGPKWTFSVDAKDCLCVAYVDCDLLNHDVPAGEANIAYSAHPHHRGKRYVSRAVRLVMQFLREHTGARDAHIIVDAENIDSLHVAVAVGAEPTEQWVSDKGRTMIRHVANLHGS